MSGGEIPFPAGRLIIHQPTYREISFFGEKHILAGAEALRANRTQLLKMDNNGLDDKTDFDILMMMIQSKHPEMRRMKRYIEQTLSLLCFNYQISFLPDRILFIKKVDKEEENGFIDSQNFPLFQKIVPSAFALDLLFEHSDDKTYNPVNERAANLARKFEERKRKLQEEKKKKNGQEGEDNAPLANIVMSVSTGTGLSLNVLRDYTLPQIMYSYKWMIAKDEYDTYIKFKTIPMADTSKMKDVDHWLKLKV